MVHTEDKARFSRVRPVERLSDINRYPKNTMTVRIYGLSAMGWNQADPAVVGLVLVIFSTTSKITFPDGFISVP